MRRVRFQHLLAFPFLVLGQAARLLGQVLLQTEGFLTLFPDDMFGSAVRQNIAGLDIVPEAGVQNGFQTPRQLPVGDGHHKLHPFIQIPGHPVRTGDEKLVVAYHEIGHALVAAKQTNSAPVQKITIIPRTSGALGYTMQVDTGDKYLLTKEELENKIATYTGGRVAEEVVFGRITTGASNDIEQATKLARAMITRYGMSDDFGMVAMETVHNQYLGGDSALTCSPDTQKEIDRKVVALVKEQHDKAKKLLEDNRAKLDELAQFLYEKETITGDEFMEILTGGEKQ